MDKMEWLSIVGLVALIVTGLVALLCAVVYFSLPRRLPFTFAGKHAFVTGGSKGIGKAVAAELVRRGCATISIAARDEKALIAATEELSGMSQSVSVRWYKLDVTQDYEKIAEVVREAESKSGPIDLLMNNAGFVVQGGFDEIDTSSFESQMKINYLSAVYATRAVISSMKARRSGHIALVSSAAGQCAIWGYTAYSPSKFALRGFAEALQMELLPHGIGVSVLFPPNTTTEGYEEELRTMPEETRQIGGAAGTFSPEEVARETVNTIACGGSMTSIGFEGWMLGTLTAGAKPEPDFLQAVAQITLGGLLRGVMLVYLGMFNRIVHKCHRAKKEK